MASFWNFLFGSKGSNDKKEDDKKNEEKASSVKNDNPFMSMLSMMDNYEEELFNSHKKAADEGDAEAQFQTGVCYEQGTGVEKDYAQARMYYAMASMQGHAFATHNLGVLYYFGYGGEQDFDRAFSDFSSAAATGDSLALASLSVCYELGRGVEKDADKADEMMKKALAQPNAMPGALSILASNMRNVAVK